MAENTVTKPDVESSPDSKNITSSGKTQQRKTETLRQMIPSQRSYDSVMLKIEERVAEDYQKTISGFTELLENDRIVREKYGNDGKDDSWKKDPEQLNEEQLKVEIELLKKKLNYVNNQNNKMKFEIFILQTQEDEIDIANHEILRTILGNE